MRVLELISFKGITRVLFVGISFFMVCSCANSKVARKLSTSFDTPLSTTSPKTLEEENSEKELSDKKLSTATTKPPSKSISKTTSNNESKVLQTITSKPSKPVKRTNKQKVKFSPQPYRIIIRLSGANPSAPAETVTRALRDAGIIFEVEKIERFTSGNLSKSKTKEVQEP